MSTPIFNVVRDARSNGSKSADFYVLATPDWVNVIALTAAQDVLLIRQFRAGTSSVTLEIPGGMVDPGESPFDAARRELLEETGYVSNDWMPCGTVHPNPAIQSNVTHTFLARNAYCQGAPRFDSNEEIALEMSPLEEIPALIRTGAISHALVLCAFTHFALRGGFPSIAGSLVAK